MPSLRGSFVTGLSLSIMLGWVLAAPVRCAGQATQSPPAGSAQPAPFTYKRHGTLGQMFQAFSLAALSYQPGSSPSLKFSVEQPLPGLRNGSMETSVGAPFPRSNAR